MNNYTVLLLRPDYIADEFGKDTYLARVAADSVEEAAFLAQAEAWFNDLPPDEPVPTPDESTMDDYHVLFVCVGHLKDLKP